MNASKKISQAKARLLVNFPYFGTLASRLELLVNDNIQSFKSDGKKLEYRKEYLQDLDLAEVEFILANGAMHATLAHEQRRQKRSGWLWQMATDIAINDMLLENGLEMPYGAQYRKRFAGMYAEEIYAELKDDILRDDEDLEYEADDKEDVDTTDKSDPKTQKQLQEEILQEQLFAQEAIALLEAELKKGDAPQSIERFYKLNFSSKIDWREELKIALDRYFRDDYTLLPPSKKLLSYGIYLPSSTSQTFSLVIAIDSSGSVDEALLNQFLSEVNFLMGLVNNYVIDLIVCDDKIHSHKKFMRAEELELELKGGGGTDFRPVFEYIDEFLDEVKLVLYFSDLEGVFPSQKPNYPVKWVSPKSGETPFGEVIVLQKD
jgi:predicted metal-dependent peptidase